MKATKVTISHVIIVMLLAGITMMSCSERRVISISPQDQICNDSTMLAITDTIILTIDSAMNPMPFVSQIFTQNGNDHYFVLDNRKLYDYNLDQKILESIHTLDTLPPLDNLSGFRILDDGAVYYDYKSGSVFILNSEGTIINMIPINFDHGIDCWGISGTEVIGNNDVVYLSGPPSKASGFVEDYNNTTLFINPKSKTVKVGGKRSDIYRDFSLGRDYYWRVFHTIDDEGKLYISLPGSTEVYVFDEEMNLIREFTMNSRYNTSLMESDKDMTHTEEKKYYLSQDSFGTIAYDPNSDLIYRIATHPYSHNNMDGKTLKPFSILVADKDGKIVTETPIINTDNSMYYDVMFATSKGLYMQIDSEDENLIKFVIFKLEKNDI